MIYSHQGVTRKNFKKPGEYENAETNIAKRGKVHARNISLENCADIPEVLILPNTNNAFEINPQTQGPSHDLWFSKKGLNLAHLNIHYLYPKLDEIKLLLRQQSNLDILCLCETFLNDNFSDDELQIQNYVTIRKDRSSLGGGLYFYIKQLIPFTRRKDLETEGLETIWIEIKLNKQQPLLLGYVYRPPSSIVNWLNSFEYELERVFLENKEVLILGDFNFDLLSDKSTTKAWLDTMQSYNFTQFIKCPTRISSSSETLIDHLFSNKPNNISAVSVPTYAISDHYSICLTHKLHNDSESSKEKIIYYRSTKHFDSNLFIQELEDQPWSLIDVFDDPNDALIVWIDIFTAVLDQHAPKHSKRVKRINQPDWINADILQAIKTRNYFHKKEDFVNYRIWRNRVKIMVNDAKTTYYSETINNNCRNPRKLWKNLHDVSGKDKNNNVHFISNANDELISDPQETADHFNESFVQIFDSVIDRTNSTSTNDINDILDKFIDDKLPSHVTFKIPDITTDLTETFLRSLDQTKAPGVDGLNVKYLRLAAPVISPSITKILNMSVRSGIFPDLFKKAKVIPIHKKGSHQDKNNYRPISVLPILSKIIERHVSNCMCDYLNNFGLIHQRQSGFRTNHSCQTALTTIVDD